MEHRERLILAALAIVGIFVLVQLGALAFVELAPEGFQVTEDGGSPTISLGFVLAILAMTGVVLVALKYGGESVLRAFILLASAYISFFALDVFVSPVLSPAVGDTGATLLSVGVALGLALALFLHPEWYVIDTAGVVMGIGAAGLFGMSFGVLPAIVLLSVLAVYDAISVYGTEHMLTLASGVMEMRVPVVLVVPLSLSYSFLDTDPPASVSSGDDAAGSGADGGGTSSESAATDPDRPDESATGSDADESATGSDADESATGGDADEPATLTAPELAELGPEGIADLDPETVAALDSEVLEGLDEDLREALREAAPDRDALFIGLGDAIIPTVLVASAAVFVETGPTLTLLGISATLPAVTAMAGTLLGLAALLYLVTRGRAHAGLPLLNGGAIAGYLVGALASGLTLTEALGLTGVL